MGCHLHGQTGRFTVWVNGKNNSEMANFHMDDRVYMTIVYKSLPFTEKRPRTPESGIRDGFEAKTTNSVPFETFRPEIYRCFLFCRTL